MSTHIEIENSLRKERFRRLNFFLNSKYIEHFLKEFYKLCWSPPKILDNVCSVSQKTFQVINRVMLEQDIKLRVLCTCKEQQGPAISNTVY